jgi:NitT/TauT family transport system ATP-binding protein
MPASSLHISDFIHSMDHDIEVADLGVRFGDLQVMENVRLSIRSGEFVTILGPSGCGKSTLLRVLAGLISPSSGSVRIGSRTRTQAADFHLSMVFQKPLLLPWRTTLENVLLPVEIQRGRRGTNATDVERARRMLDLVRLGGFENSYAFELSGGMQQRAAIARALISNPDVLLMDEPFGALDEFTREALNDEVLRIWQSAETKLKTVVMVTHSIAEAVSMSDRVFVFGPRPARLLEIVELPFEHPRNPDDSQRTEAVRRIREIVRKFS